MPSTIQLPALHPGRTQSRPARPRRFARLRAGVREALGVGAMVVAAMLPFLASPHPGAKAAPACLNPVNLGGGLHVDLNCDSHVFLLLAEDPRRVLTEEYRTWQSRPLYGALGWTLAMPFRAAGLESVGERLPPTIWAPGRGGRPATRLLPWYGGFILLNALLLAASVMLFRRLAGARSYRDAAILLPVAVLLANEVTRAFFWTPHLQMFNIFVPVLSLWLFCWMQPRLESLGWARAAGIGAALGVGALAYGAFAVPAAGAALLLAGGGPLPRRAARAAALLAAFGLPVLAWAAFVRARTGGFYAHEVERYREFVWMADAAARGPGAFAAALAHNLGEYARVLGRVAVFPALVLAALALAAHLRGTGRSAPGVHARRVAVAVMVYLLVSIPFYALMGFYAARLAWTVVPALLALVALEAEVMRQTPGSREWMVAAGAAVLAVAHAAFWVMAPGPFS